MTDDEQDMALLNQVHCALDNMRDKAADLGAPPYELALAMEGMCEALLEDDDIKRACESQDHRLEFEHQKNWGTPNEWVKAERKRRYASLFSRNSMKTIGQQEKL
jgi:hypothetical protein